MRNLFISLIAILCIQALGFPPPERVQAEIKVEVGKHATKEQTKLTKPPEQPSEVVQPVIVPRGNTCNDWLIEAGVTELTSAHELIRKESNCRAEAQNPTSTAYGIMQFLNGTWKGVGCVKTSDPVEQIRCGDKYIKARYSSWSNALAFHKANGWY